MAFCVHGMLLQVIVNTKAHYLMAENNVWNVAEWGFGHLRLEHCSMVQVCHIYIRHNSQTRYFIRIIPKTSKRKSGFCMEADWKRMRNGIGKYGRRSNYKGENEANGDGMAESTIVTYLTKQYRSTFVFINMHPLMFSRKCHNLRSQ